VVSKYQFEGAVEAGWFELGGSWATETTVSAEDVKNLTTTTSGECVGPMWGYKKRDYHQKAKVKVVGVHFYCEPCADNSTVSTLLKSPYVTCSSKEYEEYVPALKTGTIVCEKAP
jgi:hypothetical protein